MPSSRDRAVCPCWRCAAVCSEGRNRGRLAQTLLGMSGLQSITRNARSGSESQSDGRWSPNGRDSDPKGGLMRCRHKLLFPRHPDAQCRIWASPPCSLRPCSLTNAPSCPGWAAGGERWSASALTHMSDGWSPQINRVLARKSEWESARRRTIHLQDSTAGQPNTFSSKFMPIFRGLLRCFECAVLKAAVRRK